MGMKHRSSAPKMLPGYHRRRLRIAGKTIQRVQLVAKSLTGATGGNLHQQTLARTSAAAPSDDCLPTHTHARVSVSCMYMHAPILLPSPSIEGWGAGASISALLWLLETCVRSMFSCLHIHFVALCCVLLCVLFCFVLFFASNPQLCHL